MTQEIASGTFQARRAIGLVLVLASFTACGSETDAESSGTDVTRGLLSAVGAEAGGANRAPGQRPSPVRDVPLEELGFNRGSSDAPIRIIEMSDYGCGYCRQFHLETFPSLKAEFIDTGIVEWKFVPYVTGMFENSMPTLRATECTLEQSSDAFERLNERLWHEQAAWKGSNDAAGLVRSWAGAAGADLERLDDCLANGRRVDRITAGATLAREMGVRGTPTFMVLGYGPLQGALPLDTFRRVLLSVQEQLPGR